MVGNGSAVSWAADVVVGSPSVNSDLVEVVFRPRSTLGGVPVSCTRVKDLPTSYIGGAGFYTLSTSTPSETRYYFYFDPVSDTLFTPRAAAYGEGLRIRNITINYFINSYVYKSYAFANETNSQITPVVDLSGMLVQLVNAVKVPIILLLSVSLIFKLADWGSKVMVRGFEEKQSQKKLDSIMGIEDPLAFKVALNQHQKDYKARHRRYAREDRKRR